MQRSTDRILTTHTGSLPRSEALVQLMFARESGEQVDPDALAEQVRGAVAGVVRQQVEAGVDVVSDGEMSKPGLRREARYHIPGSAGRHSKEGAP